MKRTIKFRAKRADNGKWVFGDLTHTSKICGVKEAVITGMVSKPCIRISNYDIDENTIGQYIGMTDPNGKEIFEGDIIATGISRFMVVYSSISAAFCAVKMGSHDESQAHTFPFSLPYWVVGNIYDSQTDSQNQNKHS